MEGLKGLLAQPPSIATKFMGYDLEFTPPYAVRRIKASSGEKTNVMPIFAGRRSDAPSKAFVGSLGSN